MKKSLCLTLLSAFLAIPAWAAMITLTAPNGGERWALGDRQNITWTHSGASGNVRINLVNASGGAVGIIATVPVTDGRYEWTVGRLASGAAPAGEYVIALFVRNEDIDDRSNAAFTITSGDRLTLPTSTMEPLLSRPRLSSLTTTIRVTKPNTREEFLLEDRKAVRWTYANARPGQNVTIFLIRYPNGCHNAESREEISLGNVPIESGAFSWDISPLIQPCDNCTIRLSPAAAGDFAPDESDACFVLKRRPTVRVLAPNVGESFTRGSPLNIIWEADHLLPHMRIQVSLLTFDSACRSWTIRRRLAKLPIEHREYRWPGDPAVAAGRYAIEVAILTSDALGAGRYAEDISDNCFSFR